MMSSSHNYWTPTAAGYFSRVSKPQTIEALDEAGAMTTDPSGMTKAALAALAETRMAETRWLPKPLRSLEAVNDAEPTTTAAAA